MHGGIIEISFNITRGQYTTSPTTEGSWRKVTSSYTKPEAAVLLSTGATERNRILNIYDLAGNVWAWTLEYSMSTIQPCSFRGGCFGNVGVGGPACVFGRYSHLHNSYIIGFRSALY